MHERLNEAELLFIALGERAYVPRQVESDSFGKFVNPPRGTGPLIAA